MRILLTGSTGWLGRHLAPRLEAAGHAVTGLDVAPGQHTHEIGSVANRATIDRIFADHAIDAVIHAGALHKPDIARFPAQAFIDTNVTGTLHLLEAATSAGHDRFIMTSTTSLMISQAIRAEVSDEATWLDEDYTPLEPRNIYGVTKLAAENLCRRAHLDSGMGVIVLRTSRFFPEDDDTHADPPADNLKANEFLYRRLTVEDAADGHIAALDKAPEIGFGLYIASAITPFQRTDSAELKRDAAAVIRRYYPEAEPFYAARGWKLPEHIGRVYDASRLTRELGFRPATDFGSILTALKTGGPLPFRHDSGYVSPSTLGAALLSEDCA